MTEVGNFTVYEEDNVPRLGHGCLFLPLEMFAELAALVPDLVSPSAGSRKVKVSENPESPRFQIVWNFLLKHGFKPRFGYELPKKGTFSYRITRRFEEQELLDAPYLNVRLNQIFTLEGDRLPELYVKPWRPKKYQLGCIKTNQWIIVTEKLRQEMEKEKFEISFEEFCKLSDKSVIPGFYEVTSSVRMPPLKNLTILNGDLKPYDGDAKEVWYLHEGFYDEAQLHFDRTSFEKMGAFDLGLTTEVFNGKFMANRKNVCSNRLFRFLRKYDKTLDATPIRLS